MDPRALLLVVPTAAVLAALVVHSWRSLPRWRAATFWAAAALYGLLRGVVLHRVVEGGLGATFPYRIHDPLLPVFGVPLQELAGWAIVAYLGWWAGDRLAARGGRPRHALFLQLAWACLFLGAISWAVESAAVAAGWWHWTVPVRHPWLGNVPLIGLVDWFFVGTDFLLPFLALTSPALAGVRWRWATLLAFPLHFAAHLAVERPAAWFPIPPYHLAHWALLALVVGLAIRSRRTEAAFATPAGAVRHLPALAVSVVLADVVLVHLVVAGRPELLAAALPAAAVVLQALRPRLGNGLAALAAAGALGAPPLLLGVVPAAASAALRRLQGGGRRVLVVVTLAMALLAWGVHRRGHLGQEDLVARLERAVAARDRGELAAAERELAAAAEAHPGAHAPRFLLGEIHYRSGRLGAAGEEMEGVLAIRQDHLPAHRLAAVAAMRRGDREAAAAAAERGLAVVPGDPQLLYLARRARRQPVAGWAAFDGLQPAEAQGVVALAYEVGDAAGAAALLDRALDRWPGHRWFYPSRVRLALAAGDRAAAARVVERWRRRFPDDPELARLPSLAPPG